MKLNIDEENMAIAMLVQAFLGIISPNFRRISASISRENWTVYFCLRKNDGADLEEIYDAMGSLDALVLSMNRYPRNIRTVINITDENLPSLDPKESRIIFLCKE